MRGISPHFVVCGKSATSCSLYSRHSTKPFLHSIVNCLTDACQIAVNIRIGESKYLQSQRFQISGSLDISLDSFRIKVLGAVHFQNQQCFGTVEIHDIRPQNTLPAELHGISPQILIPQSVFFLGRIFAKGLRAGGEGFLLFHFFPSSGWVAPHPSRLRRATFPPRGRFQGISFFALIYRSSSEKTQPQYFCI